VLIIDILNKFIQNKEFIENQVNKNFKKINSKNFSDLIDNKIYNEENTLEYYERQESQKYSNY
jgi:hypothetical protein